MTCAACGEDPCECALNHSWKLGISTGWEQAAGLVNEMAVAAFRAGDDAEATKLRALAKRLKDTGASLHPGPKDAQGKNRR